MDSDEYGDEGDDINIPTRAFSQQPASRFGGVSGFGGPAQPSFAKQPNSYSGFQPQGFGGGGFGGFGGGMQMSMGLGMGMGGFNMGGVNQGSDAYTFDLNLDHIKPIEPPKSNPKDFKGKEKGGIMKDPSKKKEKHSVKIGGAETIHYEKESSQYSNDGSKQKLKDDDDEEEEDDSDNESDVVQNNALAQKVNALSSKENQLKEKAKEQTQVENKIQQMMAKLEDSTNSYGISDLPSLKKDEDDSIDDLPLVSKKKSPSNYTEEDESSSSMKIKPMTQAKIASIKDSLTSDSAALSRDFNYDESSSSKALTTSKPLSNPVKEIKEVAKSEDDDDDDYEVSQSQSVSKH